MLQPDVMRLEVHPDSNPDSYKEITCALEEPNAERKRKIGDWPFCKKGDKCLYSHENYGEASILEGKRKWNQLRAAKRSAPPAPPHHNPSRKEEN